MANSSWPPGNKQSGLLRLGTGVGGGLILNGKPFQGQHGVAMEVGHIITSPDGRLCGCGNTGCMEQYASASGVAFSYLEAPAVTAVRRDCEHAHAGDQHAIAPIRCGNFAGAGIGAYPEGDRCDRYRHRGRHECRWRLWRRLSSSNWIGSDPVLRGKVTVHISDVGDMQVF